MSIWNFFYDFIVWKILTVNATTVYTFLAQSIVSYGIEFWGKVFDTHIKKLHTTLNSSEIIFNKPLPNYYFIQWM